MDFTAWRQRSKTIRPSDVLSLEAYEKHRVALSRETAQMRNARRVYVGPFVWFDFENWQTWWRHIQEMLWIERGGPDQISEEIMAYAPRIPQENECVATLMIGLDNDEERACWLARLGWIERSVWLQIGGQKVLGQTLDVGTTAEGKTAAVHTVRFALPVMKQEELTSFPMVLGIDHEHYRHQTRLPNKTQQALIADWASATCPKTA